MIHVISKLMLRILCLPIVVWLEATIVLSQLVAVSWPEIVSPLLIMDNGKVNIMGIQVEIHGI